MADSLDWLVSLVKMFDGATVDLLTAAAAVAGSSAGKKGCGGDCVAAEGEEGGRDSHIVSAPALMKAQRGKEACMCVCVRVLHESNINSLTFPY